MNPTPTSGADARGRASADRRLTYAEALVEAIALEMRRDPDILCLGQDIGRFGGALQGWRGLYDEFGPHRVRDTPVSEAAMVGAAIGAALFGKRPIVEVSFGEFLPAAMNQIVLQAANLRYMTAGRAGAPLVIRTRVGDGPYRGHPQSYEAWFPHIPGLKVVMPSAPADAKGLMHAAIRDDDPVLFFEPMSLYHARRQPVPAEAYVTPIGRAAVARPGTDVSLIALGALVPPALRAAEALAREGLSVEVVDVRTLAPLDTETLLASVRRTGRAVIAHEAWTTGGFGAEIAARIAEAGLPLQAPLRRVGARPVPIPSATALRNLALPNTDTVIAAVRAVMDERRAKTP